MLICLHAGAHRRAGHPRSVGDRGTTPVSTPHVSRGDGRQHGVCVGWVCGEERAQRESVRCEQQRRVNAAAALGLFPSPFSLSLARAAWLLERAVLACGGALASEQNQERVRVREVDWRRKRRIQTYDTGEADALKQDGQAGKIRTRTRTHTDQRASGDAQLRHTCLQ